MSSSTKTILFMGATGGCGRSALQHSLDSGHTCVALARTPAKILDMFPSTKYPNLRVVQGNAHDKACITPLLVSPADSSRLVDYIIFAIGGAFNMAKFTIDDPNVCQKGIAALLDALADARAALPKNSDEAASRPRITAISSTGISKFGRDVPIAMVPLYKIMLKVPHKDKVQLETALYGERGMQERWTIVRPSILVDGASEKKIRVGIEDPVKGWEDKANGYTISREDVGKWIFENIVEEKDDRLVHKTATLSW